jgi:osmotically-inducible protein OsmY
VDRPGETPYTKDHDLEVGVKNAVIIVNGKRVLAWAKRAASGDAWERSGVSDVSNQLVVVT